MLVGRQGEMATIDQLLDVARGGRSGVLVIRGEAGIGKSAILEYAADAAADMTVLRAVGVESESELAYALVHQLLRPAFGLIERLPEPQATALRAAFALSDETVNERFRVSLGVLGLLAEVAEQGPLLCLVDDAQWLDRASADALLFVARRLVAEPIVLLFAARDDPQRPFPAPGLAELRPSVLETEAAAELVRADLGAEAPADVVEWLLGVAHGNPLALLELPRALTEDQRRGRAPLEGHVPPLTSVEQAFYRRIGELPQATRELLLIAAAEETGSRAVVTHAGQELALDANVLVEAEKAGLLHVATDRLTFRHPLVRSACYRGAGFAERERAHAAIANALDGPAESDRRAWHRAAATTTPDEDVARELERTATRAAARSGWAAAAAALERAASLTPGEENRGRRLLAAAEAAWHGGQPDRAQGLLDQASELITAPLLWADLTHLRGVIGWRCGTVLEASEMLMRGARKIADADPRKAIRMLADAGMAGWDSGDFGQLAAIGDAARSLPPIDHEEGALLADLLIGAVGLSVASLARDDARVVDAVSRAAELGDVGLLIWAAIAAEMAGDSEMETSLLGHAVTSARASGAVDHLVLALESTAVQSFLAGNLSITAEAGEGLGLAREAGLANAASLLLACLAWLAAVRGEDDECRAQAGQVMERAAPNGHGIANAIGEWAIALLDLGTGQHSPAMTRLQALAGAPPGQSHPLYVLISAPDLVEACVRCGDMDAAATALGVLRGFDRPGAPGWARALDARCRALLAKPEDAERAFTDALRYHEGGNPFDRARTQLLYGEFLRRQKRRVDAREQLRSALSEFERLRAEPWAERSRGELRASGETARKRDPSSIDHLTPQEMQIARLVGEGLSNKEAAAQLFLSPRTVDYHLRNVFAKLGITSRSELIRQRVMASPEPAAASS